MEGKIKAITYAREQKIPFFGICLGMQLAVIEFARNVAGMAQGRFHRTRPAPPLIPVIYLMKEWFDYRTGKIQVRDETSEMGGTLRLGAYPCKLKEETLARAAYGMEEISRAAPPPL